MNKYLLLCFLILGLFQSEIIAQNEPKPPVFNLTLSNNNPKIGDVIEVIIKSSIPEGMHMYSTYNKCDIGPLAYNLAFEKPTGFCTQGKPYSVGDKIINDEIFGCEVGEFFNRSEVRQKIKIISNDVKIVANVDGQWCTETACFNFGTLIPIVLKTSIKATGAPIKCDEKAVSDPMIPSAIDTPEVENINPEIDNSTSNTPSSLKNHYRLKDENDKAACEVKTFNGELSETDQENNWGLFILAFLSGLAGLLTPCVFPMIPMTVAFFLKDKKDKKKAIINGLFFGLSIIAIYVVIGTLTAIIFGADAGSFISTHWLPNVLFFLIFLVFAISFFGAFEIMLPSWLTNKVDREADKGGFYGTFFMALTLAVVSFSCTGPIVGSVLVQSAGGEFLRPVIAMIGFGLAFALPFSLFALFPNWLNSLPKSGGWLNSVKVCFGFLELALGLKFLSIADQTYHWHLLDREVYLSLWIIIFALMGIYLLGKLKFAHDSDLKYLGVPRLMFAILTLSFVAYMIPGLWGAPLKALSGYLPPMSSQDFVIHSNNESDLKNGNLCQTPSFEGDLHIPHGLKGYFDYDEALLCSKKLNKPVFIDFTGHGCVNCRKMEELVWSDQRVLKILNEEYIVASLFVDDKKLLLPTEDHFKGRFSQQNIKTLGKKNTEIEMCYFGKTSQPLYCLLDPNEDLLQTPVGSEINGKQFDTEEFLKFLQNGVAEFKKRNP
jgi:thiol:disulfide interchange protein